LNKKSQAPDFESALTELEQLVERLEQGDLPLDESLRTFERGVALTRQCQAALKDAQLKVEKLATKDGAETLEPFDDGEDGEGADDPRA
jgi:exodeoxyribonuclease VII small subunit